MIRRANVMNNFSRELLLVLLILLVQSHSLPLTSFDIQSTEDLKYYFLNQQASLYISKDNTSSFRYAVCGLTRANGTVTVNWKWMTELAHYNISAYIMQDNDYNHMSYNKNITSISISHQLSIHAGYNRGGNMYYKDKAIENGEVIWGKYTIPNSWDKALFYFTMIDQHYDYVWFIEDDVYISSLSAFMIVHELSLNRSSDLTVKEAHKNPKNKRKRFTLAHIAQPWYQSLVVALGVSKQLLSLIRAFVEKYNVLEYVEFMFTTIAMQNNLTIFYPHQFQSLMYPEVKHPCYDFITNNDSWYHPMKSFDCWHANQDDENECHIEYDAINNDSFNLSMILSTGLYKEQCNNSSYSADIQLIGSSGRSSTNKFLGPTMVLDVSLNSVSIHLLNSFNKAKYSTLHPMMKGNSNTPSTWLPMDKASMMEIRSDWIAPFALEFKLGSSWTKIGFIVYNHEVQQLSSSTIPSTSNNTISHATLSSRYLEVVGRSIREEAKCLRSTGVSLVILVRYGYLPRKLYSYLYGTISRDVDVMIIMEQIKDSNNSPREYSERSYHPTRSYCHSRNHKIGSNNNESNSMLVSHTIYPSLGVNSLDVIDISTEGDRVHLTRDMVTITNSIITRNCTHNFDLLFHSN